MKKDGYKLTKAWFDFAFENKEAKAIHTALYLWCVEVNNKLAWKNEFGLPSQHAMEVLSISSKKTYYDTLKDLESFGFIQVVQEAKNQFLSCVITLIDKSAEAKNATALSSALQQHHHQQCYSTIDGNIISIVPIDKQLNLQTNKPLNGGTAIEKQPTQTLQVAWFKKIDKEGLRQKVLSEFSQHYPADFLEYFIDYYSQDSENGGIHINQEYKFSLEAKLKMFWSDPKTKARYQQTKQLLPDEITSKPNEELAERIARANRFISAFNGEHPQQGD